MRSAILGENLHPLSFEDNALPRDAGMRWPLNVVIRPPAAAPSVFIEVPVPVVMPVEVPFAPEGMAVIPGGIPVPPLTRTDNPPAGCRTGNVRAVVALPGVIPAVPVIPVAVISTWPAVEGVRYVQFIEAQADHGGHGAIGNGRHPLANRGEVRPGYIEPRGIGR